MPKVYLTTRERNQAYLERLIRKNLNQKDLADKWGKNQSTISHKLDVFNFKYNELCDIFEMLDVPKEQIGEYFK